MNCFRVQPHHCVFAPCQIGVLCALEHKLYPGVLVATGIPADPSLFTPFTAVFRGYFIVSAKLLLFFRDSLI